MSSITHMPLTVLLGVPETLYPFCAHTVFLRGSPPFFFRNSPGTPLGTQGAAEAWPREYYRSPAQPAPCRGERTCSSPWQVTPWCVVLKACRVSRNTAFLASSSCHPTPRDPAQGLGWGLNARNRCHAPCRMSRSPASPVCLIVMFPSSTVLPTPRHSQLGGHEAVPSIRKCHSSSEPSTNDGGKPGTATERLAETRQGCSPRQHSAIAQQSPPQTSQPEPVCTAAGRDSRRQQGSVPRD